MSFTAVLTDNTALTYSYLAVTDNASHNYRAMPMHLLL